jgi:hypothetical protein
MPDDRVKNRIHVVPQTRRAPFSPEEFIEPGAQRLLFPGRGTVIFVLFPDVTESEFREILEYAMPSYVVELRTSPRFDIGNLNRHIAFQTFQHQNSIYLDLAYSVAGQAGSEPLIYRLREFLQKSRPKFDRPFIFLVNRIESDECLVPRVLETLVTFGAEPKYIMEVPRIERPTLPDYRIASL